MTTTWDVSQVDQLASDLDGVAQSVPDDAAAIVEKGALNIKTTARDLASGIKHAPEYPYSITYDVNVNSGFGGVVIEAEIGPDKALPGGPLGNIFEYGTSAHGPFLPHLGPALDASYRAILPTATGLPAAAHR